MKKVLLGIICLIFIVCSCLIFKPKKEPTSNSDIGYKIPCEVSVNVSDYLEPGYYIDTFNKPNSPYLLIITLGKRNTGGYSISVDDIKIDNKSNVSVTVHENKPSESDIVTQALTYPYICIQFNKAINKVEIKDTEGKIFNQLNN